MDRLTRDDIAIRMEESRHVKCSQCSREARTYIRSETGALAQLQLLTAGWRVNKGRLLCVTCLTGRDE